MSFKDEPKRETRNMWPDRIEERITIENMTEQDCKEAAALMQQCFSVPWSEKSLLEMFGTDGYINLVARRESTITGYIGMRYVLDEADITNVAVSPGYRRQGVGKRLLQQLLEMAGNRQINRIFLEVRVSNLAAIAFYEQAGFKKIDVRKNYYEKPREDACIMLWDTSSNY